jgi:hypothetical protein
MGTSFASKRIRKKLEKMLAGCTERHIFKGLLIEFETVGPVPMDRLVKVMLVDTPDGKRYVNFCASIESTSVVPVSSLNVGNLVVVLGEKHEHMENATFPHLIALPEEHTLLVPKEPPRFLGDSSDKHLALVYSIITVFCVFLFFMGLFLYPILLVLAVPLITISASWAMVEWATVWYQKNSRRARVLRFDPERWTDVVAFIKDRITVYKSNILDQEA